MWRSLASNNGKARVVAAVPVIFVLLWASGFIAAKVVVAHGEPLTLLTIRYAIVALMMGGIAILTRAPWPKSWQQIGHIAICGLLMQVVYFRGCWLAMSMGVGAGVTALIVCMQPVLTAGFVGPLLGERVSRRQWLGFILGLGGVSLVVANKLALGLGTTAGIVWSFIALLGITAGTLYQKKYCSDMDLRTGGVIQFVVSAIFFFPFALFLEEGGIDWNIEFVIAMIYVAIVSSLVSISLLSFMIKRGAALRVTSLFFLVPLCVLVVFMDIVG